MTQPLLLIVEETVQRVYELDGENPHHAALVQRVINAPLERERLPYEPKPKLPPRLGKRATKGNPAPVIGAPNAKGAFEALDPVEAHAVNSMMTLLHLDEGGKPFYQFKVKRTTVERGPVKS
ncbi:hypothetical protein KIKIMORA_02890 [Brevundimonas phage vB_BpoS-Kikimora]|uniref:Uncharacterized protein n=1 Tax=Brevundimonas phage vB_BpoS-Kikimora TaxID=2948601 RepID=A0A9E7MRZ5_9CAUD|nr:hypothetical protein KIKIMORA_02890 [Brevundimonas phage vB_BpoS-Kikimora]